jgi:hypothetical protein
MSWRGTWKGPTVAAQDEAGNSIVSAVARRLDTTAAMEVLTIFLSADACRASLPDPVSMVANCLTTKQLLQAFGKTWGLILIPLMTVSSVINHFEGAINGIFDSWNQRAQFGVGVRNTTSPPTAAGGNTGSPGGPVAPTDGFLGTWRHHSTELLIRSNLAASVSVNMGMCHTYDPVRFPDGDYTMCQEDADIQFTPSGNGLTGTVNLVDIAEWHAFDKPAVSVSRDASQMVIHLNDTFRVQPYQQGVLQMVWPDAMGGETMCKFANGRDEIVLKPGQTEIDLCGA